MEAVILAAGKSKRIKSKLSKIFHIICGKPMIFYVIQALKKYKIHIVANEQNKDALKDMFPFAKVHIQREQKGTADALRIAIEHIKDSEFVVVNGDMPLIQTEDVETALGLLRLRNLDCVVLTAKLKNPEGYGRIIRGDKGITIIEEKNADDEIKKIKEVNSGIYVFKTTSAVKALPLIKENPLSCEYYLTDIVSLLENVEAIEVNSENILGVNTRKQLHEARRIIQQRIIDSYDDVSFIDENNVYINYGVKIGQDTIIYPGVNLRGNTKIGKECVIENGCIIDNSVIKDNVHIKPYSVIEQSVIGDSCEIGPFAHLRPMSELDNCVRIGNFVETKKVKMGKRTKASHLTYLGDAQIGEDVNIGCGTITCNYDGYRKNETIIEDRVFVGSDVQLVAPVRVKHDALIAAGTTVTKDVEAFSLAVSRVPQINKPDWVKKYRQIMERKVKKDKSEFP